MAGSGWGPPASPRALPDQPPRPREVPPWIRPKGARPAAPAPDAPPASSLDPRGRPQRAGKTEASRRARRLVMDEAAAQDLVQDTWLRALTRPPRERGALRGWLETVVRRLASERARGRRRRLERERGTARPEETDGGMADVDRRLDFQALLLERLPCPTALSTWGLVYRENGGWRSGATRPGRLRWYRSRAE